MVLDLVELQEIIDGLRAKMGLVCRTARAIPEIRKIHPSLAEKDLTWEIFNELKYWCEGKMLFDDSEKYFGRPLSYSQMVMISEVLDKIIIDFEIIDAPDFDLQKYLYDFLPKIWAEIMEIMEKKRIAELDNAVVGLIQAKPMNIEDKILLRNDLFELSNRIKSKFAKYFPNVTEVELGMRALAIIYDWQEDYASDETAWVCGGFYSWETSQRILRNWSEALEKMLGEVTIKKIAKFRTDKYLKDMMFELYRDIAVEIAAKMKEDEKSEVQLMMEIHEKIAKQMALEREFDESKKEWNDEGEKHGKI